MPTSAITPITIPHLRRTIQFRTHPNGDCQLSEYIRTNGNWEPFETDVLIRNAPVGATAIDIGANIGYYTCILSAAVGPSGRVVAFEPDPRNFALLQANVLSNGFSNVDCIEAAVGDRMGEGLLSLCEDNWGDHRFHPQGLPIAHRRQAIRVRGISLDQFVWEPVFDRCFECPVVMKIDAQGMEARILAGMRGLLRRIETPVTMLIELWPYGLEQAGSSHEEVIEVLAATGFSLALVDEKAGRLSPIRADSLRKLLNGPAFQERQQFLNVRAMRPRKGTALTTASPNTR